MPSDDIAISPQAPIARRPGLRARVLSHSGFLAPRLEKQIRIDTPLNIADFPIASGKSVRKVTPGTPPIDQYPVIVNGGLSEENGRSSTRSLAAFFSRVRRSRSSSQPPGYFGQTQHPGNSNFGRQNHSVSSFQPILKLGRKCRPREPTSSLPNFDLCIDVILALPVEIVVQILDHLDAASLVACEQLSRSWYVAANWPEVWRSTYETSFGQWPGCRRGRDWKTMVEARTLLERRWQNCVYRKTHLDGHKDSVYCVQFDEHKIITGCRDKTVRIWDIESGRCTKVIGASSVTEMGGADQAPPMHHTGSVLCLGFDASILVTGSSDHSCIVYSLPDAKPIGKLTGHEMGVLDVCLGQKFLASGSKDKTICIWDRSTLQLVRRLRGHEGVVTAVEMRQDMVASASGDSTIKIWDVDSGTCISTLAGHTGGLAALQFSLDGTTIISGGNDKSIRIWDVPSGKIRRTITDAHENIIRTLHLDESNGRLISGGYDQRVRVWDFASGKPLLNIPEQFSDWVLSVKADSKRIVGTGGRGKVVVLDFSKGIRGVEGLE